MNSKFSEYNIIPLGDHCATAIALKEIGLRNNSFPFDWTSNKEQLYDTNIITNIELIKNLNLENIKSIVSDYIGNALENEDKVNTSNNIWFPHESNNLVEVFEKYERRFTRLYSDLTKKKNIFIIVTRIYLIKEEIFNLIVNILCDFNNENIIIFISGTNHEYITNTKYKNVIFKYINYDISRFYGFDYEVFRPEVKKYLQELLK